MGPVACVLTGLITGTVHDATTGGPLGLATVVLTEPGQQQTVIADEDGDYMFVGIPPGTYRVTIYYGEAEQSREIRVPACGVLQLDDVVDVSRTSETIVVSGWRGECWECMEGRGPGVTLDAGYLATPPRPPAPPAPPTKHPFIDTHSTAQTTVIGGDDLARGLY